VDLRIDSHPQVCPLPPHSPHPTLRLNGIKIASTHEKPIVFVKEGQYVAERWGGGGRECYKGNQSAISVKPASHKSPSLTWSIIPCYTSYRLTVHSSLEMPCRGNALVLRHLIDVWFVLGSRYFCSELFSL
jgi:hypothetical protein